MIYRRKQKVTACLSNTEKLISSQQFIIINICIFIKEKSLKRMKDSQAYHKDRSEFSFKILCNPTGELV